MARKRKKKILVGDFETTVYEGQQDTQVWASAVVELYTEDAKVFGSVEATWEYLLIVWGYNLVLLFSFRYLPSNHANKIFFTNNRNI